MASDHLSVEDLFRLLDLRPLPGEGGYFVESYRSQHVLPPEALPQGHSGARAAATSIYYLLTPESFSALHRLVGDEVYHFYLGDPVEMLLLDASGEGRRLILGRDLQAGMQLQAVVAGGTWQGSHLLPGGRYALLGTTMSPGYDADDFILGDRSALTRRFPAFTDLITTLTHPPRQ